PMNCVVPEKYCVVDACLKRNSLPLVASVLNLLQLPSVRIKRMDSSFLIYLIFTEASINKRKLKTICTQKLQV
ncbi:MAG: bifunctional pyridoxal-dependent enzyme with beta-cystathionase and maltose regulon repressor activities, partial [Alteromonas macleodii]